MIKAPIPVSRHIIDKWKGRSIHLEDLYELARVDTLEDSYQLARLAQYLEIQSADERYPKTMLSDMLKDIYPSDFLLKQSHLMTYYRIWIYQSI